MKAKLRFLRQSPQKVRLVADLIRGKGVLEAEQILHFTRKRAAYPLLKLLHSAVANGENNQDIRDIQRLYIKRIYVGDGPRLKRIQAVSRGRAHRILHRYCHVFLELGLQEE